MFNYVLISLFPLPPSICFFVCNERDVDDDDFFFFFLLISIYNFNLFVGSFGSVLLFMISDDGVASF